MQTILLLQVLVMNRPLARWDCAMLKKSIALAAAKQNFYKERRCGEYGCCWKYPSKMIYASNPSSSNCLMKSVVL